MSALTTNAGAGTVLATIAGDLAAARATTRSIAQTVENTDDPAIAKEASQRVRLAREWAKIQGLAKDMHLDLLRLEITCFCRLFQLDAVDLLPVSQREAAKFFATRSPYEIEQVLAKFSKSATARGVYLAVVKASERGHLWNHGRAIASGQVDPSSPEEVDEAERVKAFQRYEHRTFGAIAALLDEYANDGRTFYVSEVADRIIDDVSENLDVNWRDKAVHQGIREVCRKAIASGKALKIEGTKAPRFVTCQIGTEDDSEICESWVRIPFENAKLSQLAQMIDLRRVQLDQDTKALRELCDLRSLLEKHSRVPEETLGAIAMRIATRSAETGVDAA